MARAREILKDTQANLQAVADYKMHLANTAGALILDISTTSYRVKSNTMDYHPTFDEDDPINWVIDEDKLSDISDDRA